MGGEGRSSKCEKKKKHIHRRRIGVSSGAALTIFNLNFPHQTSFRPHTHTDDKHRDRQTENQIDIKLFFNIRRIHKIRLHPRRRLVHLVSFATAAVAAGPKGLSWQERGHAWLVGRAWLVGMLVKITIIKLSQ